MLALAVLGLAVLCGTQPAAAPQEPSPAAVAAFDRGRTRQQRGALEEAGAAYEEALRLSPAFVHAANNLGALYKQLGEYALAERVLTDAIAADGAFAGLEYNLGMVLAKRDEPRRAAVHLQAALRKARAPEPPPRWHDDLAAVLEAVGRLSEAAEQSAQAVALDPGSAKFARRLARLTGGADAEETAEGRFNGDVAAAADLEAAGDVDGAYAAYTQLSAARPDDDDLWYRLAWNRFTQKDYYPAHTHLAKALALAPAHRDYLAFMGALLHETGNWEEAAAYLEDALKAAGDGSSARHREAQEGHSYSNEEFEIWYNLGIVHKDLGNHQASANAFHSAYTLSAKRGAKDSGAERVKYLALAVEQSNKACDWRRLAELLPRLVRRLQAGDAAALRATDPYESLLYIGSAATSLKVARQYVADLNAGTAAQSNGQAVVPLETDYAPWLSLAATLRVGILSADLRKHPVAQTLLGVLSALRSEGDLGGAGALHVTVFSMCPDKPEDDVQQAVREEVDDWRDVHAMSDQDAAQTIADVGVHVLLEMQGHTLHRRPGIALRKPAPVVLSMQGFPASTGVDASALQYLLADRVVLPPELATPDTVSEDLVYMPYSFMACGYSRSLAIPPSRGAVDQGEPARRRTRVSWVETERSFENELDAHKLDSIVAEVQRVLRQHPTLATESELAQAGLQRTAKASEPDRAAAGAGPQKGGTKGVTVCANNRAAKVSPTALTLWINAVRRVPSARLWLDGQFQDARANLLAEAAARGLDRIDAEREPTYEGYMRRLEDCAVFLDSLSYNAHTVGLDALYMGLPLMTTAGAQMANRVGASLMAAADLGRFVEPSLKAYEDAAVQHLRPPNSGGGDETRVRRSMQLERMPRARRGAPLFDAATYAEELGAALRGVYS